MRLATLPVNMFFGPGISFDSECLRTNPWNVQPTVTTSRLLTLRTPLLLDSRGSTLVVCVDHYKAVARRRSVKKVFLKIAQNTQENTCAGVSLLIKLWSIQWIFLITVVCDSNELLGTYKDELYLYSLFILVKTDLGEKNG